MRLSRLLCGSTFPSWALTTGWTPFLSASLESVFSWAPLPAPFLFPAYRFVTGQVPNVTAWCGAFVILVRGTRRRE